MATPLLTVDLPGTGGRVREAPEDFVVEELPSYEPSGAGDHTFLLVEKRGLTTLDAARAIARAVGVPVRSVGYAGLKDKWALTRQTLSVEHVSPTRAGHALEGVSGLRLLRATPHGNKLRLGHLRGNRFALRVRGVGDGAADRARAVLEELRARGAPNGFGEQRFGLRGDNHDVGRELVRGDPEAALAVLLAHEDAEGEFAPAGRTERRLREALDRGKDAARALATLSLPVLRLYVSAYQSHLFNLLLAERLHRLGTLEAGDLAFLHAKGAVFRVDDPESEQPRADRLELSPSAPLFPAAPCGCPSSSQLSMTRETPSSFTSPCRPAPTRRPSCARS
jgi:tRNA pseudouridine13 synthase